MVVTHLLPSSPSIQEASQGLMLHRVCTIYQPGFRCLNVPINVQVCTCFSTLYSFHNRRKTCPPIPWHHALPTPKETVRDTRQRVRQSEGLIGSKAITFIIKDKRWSLNGDSRWSQWGVSQVGGLKAIIWLKYIYYSRLPELKVCKWTNNR